MLRELRSCVVLLTILWIVTGLVYPLAVTVIAQSAFPDQVDGSLIKEDGKVIGSRLIGQAFNNPGYFWSRPSAASYNAGASTGSNFGPTNPALLEGVAARVKDLGASEKSPTPIDLATASGSGLDPHISPAAAYYQVGRVARARKLSEEKVRELVNASIEERTMGILGERRVNVLELNRSLNALANGATKR